MDGIKYILYDPGHTTYQYFLMGFSYENGGFRFSFCMDPADAIVFDAEMLGRFRSFFASCTDDEFPFLCSIYSLSVPN